MTTKSPAENFGQQAEAVAGKRMSWTDTAARMLLGPAIASVVGYSIGTGIQRRQEAQQAARDAQRAADRSAALAAQREAHRRAARQLREERAARAMVDRDFYRFDTDYERVLHGRTLRAASAQGRDARQLRTFPYLRLPNNEI